MGFLSILNQASFCLLSSIQACVTFSIKALWIIFHLMNSWQNLMLLINYLASNIIYAYIPNHKMEKKSVVPINQFQWTPRTPQNVWCDVIIFFLIYAAISYTGPSEANFALGHSDAGFIPCPNLPSFPQCMLMKYGIPLMNGVHGFLNYIMYRSYGDSYAHSNNFINRKVSMCTWICSFSLHIFPVYLVELPCSTVVPFGGAFGWVYAYIT